MYFFVNFWNLFVDDSVTVVVDFMKYCGRGVEREKKKRPDFHHGKEEIPAFW